MGTIDKIIGVAATSINKLAGVAISGLAKMTGQTISLFSTTKSMDFDGTDDHIQISNTTAGNTPANLEFASDESFSIEAWIKSGSSATGDKIFYSQLGIGTSLIWCMTFLTSGNRRIKFYIRDDSGNVTTLSSTNNSAGWLADDTWYHVGMVRDVASDKLYLYKNGVSVQTAATDTTTDDFSTFSRIVIGCDPYDYTPDTSASNVRYEFPGRIASLAVWDIALSAANCVTLYNSGDPVDNNSQSFTGADGPVSWWRMGNDSGDSISSILDKGSDSNNGTPQNMVSGDIVTDAPSS